MGPGVASYAVAESLGHHTFATTSKYYAQPAASSNAGTARVVGMLKGATAGSKLAAEELLRKLGPETLAHMAALLAASNGKGAASG